MLGLDEEYLLAKRWREHGDSGAAQRLVSSHLRLVVKIAKCCRSHTLPLSELISEGNVGLIQAVDRFDPERGFRLTTYAAWWIRAAIQRYIMSSSSLVRMGTTTAQKKLFFGLRSCKEQLQALDDGELSPENARKIAGWLDVSEADVIEMNHRLAGPDLSLNGSPGRPISEYGEEWLDILPDSSPDQETLFGERTELRQRLRLLNLALKHLDPRERDIISERRLREQPTTLRELGKRYAVSPERMRQIEARALEKLRRSMHAARSPSAWSRRGERPSAGRPNVHAQVHL
jgi:RNA polymerase sigma-32 factor